MLPPRDSHIENGDGKTNLDRFEYCHINSNVIGSIRAKYGQFVYSNSLCEEAEQ